MKKPEPTVHEVGSEFIGELHWLQKVITRTRQIYHQCIDIQTNPQLLKDISNSKLTETLKTKQYEQAERVNNYNIAITEALIYFKKNGDRDQLRAAID